jgi:hypothetical protein
MRIPLRASLHATAVAWRYSAARAAGSSEPEKGGPSWASDLSWPNGQRLELPSVSYTNVVLTDTTAGAPTPVADASEAFLAL